MKKLFFLLLFVSAAAFGQASPAKRVGVIVSSRPGGSSDLMSRVYGARLSELWGQPVIIESKPGAQGAVGTEYTARQAPDGYTFTVANLQPVAVNPLLSKVPYNIEKDFVAGPLISSGPNILTVRADWPFRSLADIINFARQNPGKLNSHTTP